MAQAPRLENSGGIAELIDDLVAAEGTGAHSYFASGELWSGSAVPANTADAIHFFCSLYGNHPSMVALAAAGNPEPSVSDWFFEAAQGFAVEREYLARLASAALPMPGTPGHQHCEAAVLSQRHALEMLAQSERRGCAMGAIVALTLDWRTIRTMLDLAAERLDVPVFASNLPDLQETATLVMTIGESEAASRALDFGVRQLLAQHRAFWTMLESRAQARSN